MPFYATAYDTTAGRGVSVTKVVGAIQQALVRENFALVNNQDPVIQMPIPQDGCVPTLVSTSTDTEMSIPVFSHPVFVDLSSIRKSDVENYMVSDARAFMIAGSRRNDGAVIIKNKTEFEFTKNRTILSSLWYKREIDEFKSLDSCLTNIYAAWVSETITRRFGLDANDQQRLAILAAYHYQSLFYPYSKFDEQDILRMAPKISRATYADIEKVLEILEQYPVMEGLFDYCKNAIALCDNPRLEDLNPGLLVSMISTSWIGTNGREIAAVALEHVPTFVMIVFSAFTERTYRVTSISKIVERFAGRKGEESFIRSLKRLMQDNKPN